MTHPEFLTKIDWKLLRKQKKICLKFIDRGYELGHKTPDAVRGLIHLVDAIQDYACDEMGLSEEEVFNLNPKEE